MKGDSKKQPSAAQGVRGKVLASRDRIWLVEEFDGSVDAVQSELRRLVLAGELEHLRRGVYWRGRKTRFGMTVASEAEALLKVLGRNAAVGAAGWSATNLLGLSTQISPVEALAVTARPPAGFSRLKLIDRSRRVGRSEQSLNGLEIAILEALDGWDRYIEEPAEFASARFHELFGRDDVRVGRLVSASRSESVVVRERLRWLLAEAGWDAEADRVRGARSGLARDRALAVFRGHSPEPVRATA